MPTLANPIVVEVGRIVGRDVYEEAKRHERWVNLTYTTLKFSPLEIGFITEMVQNLYDGEITVIEARAEGASTTMFVNFKLTYDEAVKLACRWAVDEGYATIINS